MRSGTLILLSALVIFSLLAGCSPAAPAQPTVASAAPTQLVTSGGSAAPASPGSGTPTAAAASIKRGGHFRSSEISVYDTFDSHVTRGNLGVAFQALYDGFLRFDVDQNGKWDVGPDLAESWEINDPKTMTFKLRKGVKFHDGTDWNADVAKWNLERMRDHPKTQARVNMISVDSIDKVDDYTVRLKLKSPSASQLVLLSPAGGRLRTLMLSKAAVEKMGDDPFGAKPVGSGPFKFVEWSKDDFVTLEKNPDYWMKGADGQPLPYLDKMTARVILDQSISLLELKAGNLEAVRVLAKDIATVQSSPDLIYNPAPFQGFRYFIGMNKEKEPFTNQKVRQAMPYAIDRAAGVKAITLGHGWERPYLLDVLLPGGPGYDASVPPFTYDPAKAKSLFAEGGYKGAEVVLTSENRVDDIRNVTLYEQMLAAVGFKAKLDVLERLTALNQVRNKNFVFWAFLALPLADPDMEGFTDVTEGSANWQDFRNADVDKCFDEGRQVYEVPKRMEVYRKCERILKEDASFTSTWAIPGNNVLRKNVRDFKVQWIAFDLRSTWLDR